MVSETPSGLEEWSQRPPYKAHRTEEFGTVYWTGKCHCGRVTYQINRERPLDVKYCHCTGCQVLHGAPFQWAAIFHKSDMTFTHGTQGLNFYNSAEKQHAHHLPCKVSCSYCHSPIMDEGRNVILLFPSLIESKSGLEEEGQGGRNVRKIFEPSCHIFYSQRVVDVRDGKPKWAGMNDSSDLIHE
ncbi:uncharacterized protein BDCG_04579 [Blastomyces dermatitidis ER-3]|uniref:CENP-V/GFA domain-containing protein n=2 Tax=Blastomyces TaxID=229219 RepID=A0A179UCX0_BLAGS|nr:uncharacterized protein BDBG_01563 [Blastomyces gilchristii SLH14081]XP_045276380.1 uncharacterized protein BDCG_04579 [Blastomyces dermatitidis ER-3]EEQ89459.2 hypothetical protein BDCG_04579 [Blastomyces dermatitidis ER-3]OAT05128.1 hypothetical protein BDBG_01563 [Blastomyces gilchristii SLH14081]